MILFVSYEGNIVRGNGAGRGLPGQLECIFPTRVSNSFNGRTDKMLFLVSSTNKVYQCFFNRVITSMLIKKTVVLFGRGRGLCNGLVRFFTGNVNRQRK